MCEACGRGDHRFCGMQTWCECDDGRDGEASREEFEAYHSIEEPDDRDECWMCFGLGEIEDDCTCGEDTCCCLYPEPPICSECHGSGRSTIG